VTPILTHEQPIVGLEPDGKRRKSRLPRRGGRPRHREIIPRRSDSLAEEVRLHVGLVELIKEAFAIPEIVRALLAGSQSNALARIADSDSVVYHLKSKTFYQV
jgi:hypothetical protein